MWMAIAVIVIKPSFQGLLIDNGATQTTKAINTMFSQDAKIDLSLQDITSLRLSGKLIGQGSATVLIIDGTRTYFVYDSASVKQGNNLLTGKTTIDTKEPLKESENNVYPFSHVCIDTCSFFAKHPSLVVKVNNAALYLETITFEKK